MSNQKSIEQRVEELAKSIQKTFHDTHVVNSRALRDLAAELSDFKPGDKISYELDGETKQGMVVSFSLWDGALSLELRPGESREDAIRTRTDFFVVPFKDGSPSGFFDTVRIVNNPSKIGVVKF